MLLTGGFSFPSAKEEKDCDEWYRKEVSSCDYRNSQIAIWHIISIGLSFSQHLDLVSRTPGYLRTTRWKLLYHRNNAISRQLKGLPPNADDAAALEAPPTFLALHEFDRVELDVEALTATGETE